VVVGVAMSTSIAVPGCVSEPAAPFVTGTGVVVPFVCVSDFASFGVVAVPISSSLLASGAGSL